MTYGNFKEECAKSENGVILFSLWWTGKLALYPAMKLLSKLKD